MFSFIPSYKRLVRKLGVLGLLAVLGSCQGLLDKEPQNKISLEETFQDIESATVALSGAYRSLFESNYLNGNRTFYPDLAGGNLKYSATNRQILGDVYNFTADPDGGSMNSTYAQLYSILNNFETGVTSCWAIACPKLRGAG